MIILLIINIIIVLRSREEDAQIAEPPFTEPPFEVGIGL